MKKRKTRRTFLGVLQHFCGFVVAILVSLVCLNSFVLVENMYGEKVGYDIKPLQAGEDFSSSPAFNDMFRGSIEDITRLAVIMGQLETNGEFDGNKKISVTDYVNRKTLKSKCPVTAVYDLEELIKWGKYGVEFQEVRFEGKRSFLNYFGVNTINELGTMIGEDYVSNRSKEMNYSALADTKTESVYSSELLEEADLAMAGDVLEIGIASDYPSAVSTVNQEVLFQSIEDEYMVDQVFEYVVEQMNEQAGKTVNVVEDNGKEYITLSMIVPKYEPEGGLSLVALSRDWIEYSMLEANVYDAIDNLTYNYNQYQNRNDVYEYGRSNVHFVIRTKTAEGMQYYSNLPQALAKRGDSEQNEYFASLGRYLMYVPDNMRFETNAMVSEKEIFDSVSGYEYAFPENTQIWIGVDTTFPVTNDSFAYANRIYSSIVPYTWQIIIAISSFAFVWFLIWLYFSYTTGKTEDESKVNLSLFDKLPTEISLVIIGIFVFVGVLIGVYLFDMADYNLFYRYGDWAQNSSDTKLSLILLSGIFGLYTSMVFSLFWYSLLRRLRAGNLWSSSFAAKVFSGCMRVVHGITQNPNATVRALIPYNMFLMFNLVGAFFVGAMWTRMGVHPVILFGVVFFLILIDAGIGVWLFRNASERNEIMEGIASIRDGETDYLLDSTLLHGENKALADGVNNIGEGIRKAVETSMKDENTKADLITNVSHDIKTPLTSIINYVNLLKREGITTEPVAGYIRVLDEKTQRLKQLTDDLVEASKISSGNIELVMAPLNLGELVNQAIGEFYERFEEKDLTIVLSAMPASTAIYADSRRMWRVIENLFNNLCKYALPGTRVYVDLTNEGGKVDCSIKNISANPLNIRADELTERFIRGDVSRSTEGSGLGLSIAKSLTELQKGEFVIHMDGDLFKVSVRFKEYIS